MSNYVSALTGAQMDDALTQLNNRVAEGWAVGEKDGVPVSSDSLYYENNAKYYAQQAGISAAAAAQSASTAEQDVEEGIKQGIVGAYVQESATPGAIVTIDDGADDIYLKDLTVDLAIDQDLHGYSNPWPAGGGKNKCIATLADLKTKNTAGTWNNNVYTRYGTTFTINIDNAGNVKSITVNGVPSGGTASILFPSFYGDGTTSYINSGCPSGGSSQTYLFYSSVAGTNTGLDQGSGSPAYTPANEAEISPRIVVYTTATSVNNLVFYPMTRISSETADFAPYSNICPIYPVTEVEVSRTGKNLDFKTISGYTVNSSGNISANASYDVHCAAVKAGETYTFATDGATGNGYCSFFYDEPIGGSASFDSTRYSLSNGTITAPIDGYIGIRATAGATKCQLELGSTATAYEAYKGQTYLMNIGINQWDEEWELGRYDASTGAAVAETTYIRCKNKIAVTPSTSYYFVNPAGNDKKAVVLYYDATDTFISSVYPIGLGTFTTPSNCAYIRFYMYAGYGTTYLNDISINYPSRFTSYYPYTGHTVYGGELDVTTGVLTATHAMVDLGDYTWTAETNFFYATLAEDSVLNTLKVYCTTYKRCTQANGNDIVNATSDKVMGAALSAISPNLKRAYVRDTTYTDAATFKTAVTGQKLVYELATPITIQLTPTQITTLRGSNTIWADAGSIINCEYRADLKMYIDKVLGA